MAISFRWWAPPIRTESSLWWWAPRRRLWTCFYSSRTRKHRCPRLPLLRGRCTDDDDARAEVVEAFGPRRRSHGCIRVRCGSSRPHGDVLSEKGPSHRDEALPFGLNLSLDLVSPASPRRHARGLGAQGFDMVCSRPCRWASWVGCHGRFCVTSYCSRYCCCRWGSGRRRDLWNRRCSEF